MDLKETSSYPDFMFPRDHFKASLNIIKAENNELQINHDSENFTNDISVTDLI